MLYPICKHCDDLVIEPFYHYAYRHPELRSPEDWEFVTWPDGEQALVDWQPFGDWDPIGG